MTAARDGIDAVLRDRGLRRSTPEHTARSLLLGAAASATLEGDPVEADDLAAGAGGPTARASLQLSGQLLGLMTTWERAPVQAIARIHALAAAGSVRAESLGRPANPEGVARLGALAQDLSRPTEAPALVVAALVHAEILAARAFGSHDGVVARAAERLVLVSRGIDPASVTVPEAAHAVSPRGYAQNVGEYLEGGTHAWLLYAAEAYTRAAELSPVAR